MKTPMLISDNRRGAGRVGTGLDLHTAVRLGKFGNRAERREAYRWLKKHKAEQALLKAGQRSNSPERGNSND